MAKDSRRGAINRLSAECGFRAGVWGFTFELANNAGLDFSSHDIRYEQIAPNRHIQIASYQEVIVPVTFHIPGALREFADGRSKVEIEPSSATVADALAALWTLYPGVRDRIMNEQGQVREHINIFVGDEDIRYTGGLMSPLAAESQISIVPAISGG